MQSDIVRELAFHYARQAVQARRLAQGMTRESDRKALEEYAAELSERAITLMAGASWRPLKNGRDLVLHSLKTLETSKPRYP